MTSHDRALPACHGINVRPLGRFLPDRNRPWGSLVTGMHAEAKARVSRSFTAWCLADLPGVHLQQGCGGHVCQPVSHNGMEDACAMHNGKPSLKPKAVLTASSSSLRSQDAIGKVKSQSPLCGEDVARKEVSSDWTWPKLCLLSLLLTLMMTMMMMVMMMKQPVIPELGAQIGRSYKQADGVAMLRPNCLLIKAV